MEGLLNFLTGLSILLLIMILSSVRRSHIRVEYSVSWLGAAVILLLLSRSPLALQVFANVLGVNSGSTGLFLLVGCLFLFVLFRFSIIISALKDANIALAQRVAILEYHVTKHEEARQ